MRILYLDCSMGADAQRIASALFGLVEDKDSVIRKLNMAGSEEVRFSYEEDGSSGFLLMADKENMAKKQKLSALPVLMETLPVSEDRKEDIRTVLETLSSVQGEAVDDSLFIAYLLSICCLMDELKPDRIYASPVCLGKGPLVREGKTCMVPSYATARLLKGIPVYAGNIGGELCTPEAAALLRHYVDHFESMPLMSIATISYGRSIKNDRQLCLPAYLGRDGGPERDRVILIHANLDDMTGEAVGFAQEMLFASGALDVYITPIQMKKNRPGFQLSCICREDVREACIEAFLRYTTTLGVRYETMDRRILSRSFETRQTEAGEIRLKKSYQGDIRREKGEYADLSRIARDKKISLKDAERYLY